MISNSEWFEIKPIKDTAKDFAPLEKLIKQKFRDKIFLPLMRELGLPESKLVNSSLDALYDALRSGRITYQKGTFRGKFDAKVTRELKSYGAYWDRKTSTFQIAQSDLPMEIRSAIAAGEVRFQERLKRIDKQLAQFLPAKFADEIHMEDIFDTSLWKVDKEFRKTLAGITVPPQLSPAQAKRIAAEWQNNMRLWIEEFTKEEILELRFAVGKSAYAGNRYESLMGSIQKSYGVSTRKARFLARQETNLLMAKFKETRYADAGIHEYTWGCVAGSKNHPVRPSHKILEGKVFRWDTPPITTAPGEPPRRNNPGEDYGCRCFPRPIVRF